MIACIVSNLPARQLYAYGTGVDERQVMASLDAAGFPLQCSGY